MRLHSERIDRGHLLLWLKELEEQLEKLEDEDET